MEPPETSLFPEMITTAEIKMEMIKITQTSKEHEEIGGMNLTSSSDAADKIASNEDLLIEILLRLPVISLIRFKSVSKHWYSLVTSLNFTLLRNTKADPPSGLFLPCHPVALSLEYDFVPIGNLVQRPPFTTLDFESGSMAIIQSSNGLLLCAGDDDKLYVYNPTTNRFAVVPQPHDRNLEYLSGITLAFDPSESPHYKIVCIFYSHEDRWVEIYSSATGNWSVCSEHMEGAVNHYGVYCNGAVHWMTYPDGILYLKLDEQQFHHIDIETPEILDDERHGKFLVDSRDGMLHLVIFSVTLLQLNVYERDKDYSGWSIKYRVDLNEIIKEYPEIDTPEKFCFTIQSTVLGGNGEDSFLVLELPGKLIHYDLLSRTSHKLCDFAPGTRPDIVDFDSNCCFHFIASLAGV